MPAVYPSALIIEYLLSSAIIIITIIIFIIQTCHISEDIAIFMLLFLQGLHALLFFPNWLLNFSLRKRHVKENTSFCAKNEGIFCLSLAMV